MIVTIQLCGRCASDQVRKNGSSGGRAKYQCKACSYQGYLHPVGPAQAVRYAQVEKLLVGGHSQRSVVRATGVSRMTVAKLAKKIPVNTPNPAANTAGKGPAPRLGHG